VVPFALSQLRPARRLRVPLRRPDPANPVRKQLAGGAAGAVVPPFRLPPLADRPARRPDQRGHADRLARGGGGRTAAPGPAEPAGRLTDPARPLTFTFEGRPVPAIEGQSIAAALYAAGQRVFTRSFKYHRPRGLLCAAGDCPNCLMEVDGRPNVRTCTEPARQ